MFNNSFTNQHRFYYSDPSDNKDDEMLVSNVIANIDDDVNDKLIPHVLEFGNSYGFIFAIFHD